MLEYILFPKMIVLKTVERRRPGKYLLLNTWFLEYDISYLEFSFQSGIITSAREVESLNVQFEAAMMVLKNTVEDKTSIEFKEVFVSIMNGKPITSSAEKIIRYFDGVFLNSLCLERGYMFSLYYNIICDFWRGI